MSYAESQRATEVLRSVWKEGHAKAIQWATGGLKRLQKAEVLFSLVRQYEDGSDEARVFLEGQKASERFLRSLRVEQEPTSAPPGPGHNEQWKRKYSDAVQTLSRLLAHVGQTDWEISGWEDGLARVANGIPSRVDRLKGLGNAVVPQIPELIGRAILEEEL